LLALFNPRDAAHARAVEASRAIQGNLLTTDWILTETADALCGELNRVRCVAFLEDLRNSLLVEIEPASRKLFAAGWKLYRDRPDKDWSLTDCISFVVMHERGVSEALTADHHFEQAGFKILLK
jgi:predicted nucleic acid-binding protein